MTKKKKKRSTMMTMMLKVIKISGIRQFTVDDAPIQWHVRFGGINDTGDSLQSLFVALAAQQLVTSRDGGNNH